MRNQTHTTGGRYFPIPVHEVHFEIAIYLELWYKWDYRFWKTNKMVARKQDLSNTCMAN